MSENLGLLRGIPSLCFEPNAYSHYDDGWRQRGVLCHTFPLPTLSLHPGSPLQEGALYATYAALRKCQNVQVPMHFSPPQEPFVTDIEALPELTSQLSAEAQDVILGAFERIAVVGDTGLVEFPLSTSTRLTIGAGALDMLTQFDNRLSYE